jgi:hypothetical protein
MNDYVRATCLTDARYALRQLRQFRDIGRAIDALERIECRLEHADEYDEPEPAGDRSAGAARAGEDPAGEDLADADPADVEGR